MAIEMVTIFKDSESGKELDFISCPCGNNVYYVSKNDEKICTCCKLKHDASLESTPA